MDAKKWGYLALSIIICQSAGLIGSVFTIESIPTWFASLTRPEFAPPNFLFGPVWITLYTLMGVSAWLVWESDAQKKEKTLALSVFSIQLILNAAWSIIFFGLQELLFAFIEIIALWIAIIASIFLFYKIDKRAAYLLIPYILWVSFAAVLNYSFWALNQA